MFPKQPPDSANGCDPALIEEPAPFTVEMSRYRKHGELLRIAPVTKDMARIGQGRRWGRLSAYDARR